MTTKKAPSPEILDLDLSKISGVDPLNPRIKRSKEADLELQASIEVVGLLQPITVRKDPDQAGKYLVVFGQRRYQAAKALKLKTVRALAIEPAPGQDLAELAVTENIQRAAMDPVDEIFAIAQMLQRVEKDNPQGAGGLATRYVAKTLGKPYSYVARRALAARIPKGLLRKMQKASSPFRSRGIDSVLLFAQLPEQEQKDLLDSRWFTADPLELQDRVTANVLSLAAAKFDTAEKQMPGAPACVNCPKNTANTPGLFGECDKAEGEKPEAVCRDRACYESKLGHWVEDQVAKHREKYGSSLLILHGVYEPSLPKPSTELRATVDNWKVEKAKKSDKGARPAVPLQGKGAGLVRWVKPHASTAGDAGKPPSAASVPKGERTPEQDLEAKVERLDQRRRNAFVEHVRDRIQTRFATQKTPSTPAIARMLLAYGLRRTEHYDLKRRAEVLHPESSYARELILGLLPEIDATMRPGMYHRYEEAVLAARMILDLDPLELEAEVAEEIPESSALQKLRDQVKANKKKAAPKKKATRKKKAAKK